MAKIMGYEQQQEAMKNIRSGLKEIEGTNVFLDSANETGKYTVYFSGPDGKRVSATILCPDKAVIDQLVRQYKESVAQDLASQAEANRIELEPDEKTILGL